MYKILGTTGPDKECSLPEYRRQVMGILMETLDGCTTEEAVLNLIGGLSECIDDCYHDDESPEMAADCILDGLQGE